MQCASEDLHRIPWARQGAQELRRRCAGRAECAGCAGFGRARARRGARARARARVGVLYYPQYRTPQHASASLKSHRNFKFSFWNCMSTFTLWTIQNSDARAHTVRLTRFGWRGSADTVRLTRFGCCLLFFFSSWGVRGEGPFFNVLAAIRKTNLAGSHCRLKTAISKQCFWKRRRKFPMKSQLEAMSHRASRAYEGEHGLWGLTRAHQGSAGRA